MNIHQLSVSYDERQDRLQLKLNTQDGQEFRFWLTRRMAMRLMPAMEQAILRLEAAQPGMAATDASSQHMLAEIKRDAFLQTADFATPYTAAPQQLPLGDEPLLLTHAQLSLLPHGALQLIFHKKTAEITQSCQLNLQAPLVHGMIHLIQQCMANADWALAPPTMNQVPKDAPASPVPPQVYKH